MSWNIHNAIVRGEIDNTTPGRTIGRLWLIHQHEPLELELVGNCRRDLAGTVLTFRNPLPKFSLEAPTLADPQIGIVGDMTASLKRKVYLGDALDSDHTWQNVLSLEWFDETNGRVVIESSRFELSISESEWQQNEEADEAQMRTNLEAMRDYVSTLLQRDKLNDLWGQDNADEFAWEKRFQESDRFSEIYHEVSEKYFDDFYAFEKQAYVMGMSVSYGDSGNDDMEASDDESIELFADELMRLDEDDWLVEHEGINFDEEEFGDLDMHPLQQRAHDLTLEAMEHFSKSDHKCASDLCSNLLLVSSKLAGALYRDADEEQEPGYILASLKRCLHWQNLAISACHELLNYCDTDREENVILKIRAEIFDIRDQITEMRREFKQN
jgi:hypothetical protein